MDCRFFFWASQGNTLLDVQAGLWSMVLGKDISGGCHPEVMILVIPYNFHERGTLILLRID